MFLAVTCQHASGSCQSHSRPVLNLREASRKYIELSPSTPSFLTLRFYKKDLTPTPNLLRISGQYSLCLGISLHTPMKRNKRDGIDDASNEQKRQKTNNNAKSKEALDNTSSKTGAVTVHDVDNFVATCTADPDSSGNARHDEQQQKQQSKETTE